MAGQTENGNGRNQSGDREVLKAVYGNYQLTPQVALSKPGTKAVVSTLLNEDNELVRMDQLQRYLSNSYSSGFVPMNMSAKRTIAETILGYLPPDAKINVEAFLRLVMATEKIRNDEAMVRVVIAMCDVTGKNARQLLVRDKSTYEFSDLEEDWTASGVMVVTSTKSNSKESSTIIIVPDSPIMGVVYDRNDETIMNFYGSYEIRRKAGLQYVLHGVKSAPFGLRGKAATIATAVNEGLANIVTNFGYDEPSTFVQAPRDIPIVGQISGTETIPARIAAGLKRYKELLIDVAMSREDDEGQHTYTVKAIQLPQELAAVLIDVDSSMPLGYLLALTEERSMNRVSLLDAVKFKVDFEKKRAQAAAEFVNSNPEEFEDIMQKRKEQLEKMRARRSGATRSSGTQNRPTPAQGGASIRFNMKR
jgi:hypothetical protein